MAYPLLAAAAPIIAAGVQGLGNAISSNQSKGNDNIDFQDAMDWRNYLHQLEFAQKGIQWRTQDAIKAGLHPLAALGAQTTSFQPQQVFPPQDGGNKWSWLGDFGQNMSRAVMAAADSNTRRIQEAEVRIREAQAQYAENQNAAFEQSLNQQGQVGPAFPSRAALEPVESALYDSHKTPVGWQIETQNIPASNQPGYTAGHPQASDTLYRTPQGEIIDAPSRNFSEPMESDIFVQSQRFFGKAWDWSRGLFNWYLNRHGGKGSDAQADFNAWVDSIAKRRDDLARRYPLPEGWEYRYNPRTYSFWEVEVGDSTGLFIDE